MISDRRLEEKDKIKVCEKQLEVETDAVKIEELVKESLDTGNKTLGLLLEGDMAQALEDYVMRKANSAINDTVEESLEKTQKTLASKITNENEVGAMKIREVTAQLKKENEEKAVANAARKTSSRDVFEMALSDCDDNMSIPVSTKPTLNKSAKEKTATTTAKKRAAATKSRKKKLVVNHKTVI